MRIVSGGQIIARTALTGSRIRALRLARRLPQADLARMAGVSPSYLNLIEHNRRRAGARLLSALARVLDVAPESLEESAAEAQIAALAGAAAAAPAASEPRPEAARAEDFAGRFPGWAGLVTALHARLQAQERAIEQMSDRMAHDPNLSAALHEIVSMVTAVQSTSAILIETEDLEPEERGRFIGNIHGDAARLARAAEALVSWLDLSSGTEAGPASPQEELETWLERRGFHLPELEEGDRAGAELSAPPAELAMPALVSEAARSLASAWLARAGEEARLLPAARLAAALQDQIAAGAGVDPARLAMTFGVAPGLVMRRLALLPPAPGLPRFGLILCDGSGAITFRRPVEGFTLPRFGHACAVWPLFEALQQPGRPVRALLETVSRPPQRFLAHAISEAAGAARFEPPWLWEAAMLLTPATVAVLGGVPGASGGAVRQVGSSCRVCALESCAGRREPSILLA